MQKATRQGPPNHLSIQSTALMGFDLVLILFLGKKKLLALNYKIEDEHSFSLYPKI